jgi:hypothetical protein
MPYLRNLIATVAVYVLPATSANAGLYIYEGNNFNVVGTFNLVEPYQAPYASDNKFTFYIDLNPTPNNATTFDLLNSYNRQIKSFYRDQWVGARDDFYRKRWRSHIMGDRR